MLRTSNDKIYESLNEVLVSRNWGTIGSKSVIAASMISESVASDGSYKSYVCDGSSAALDSIIRGFLFGYGDKIVVPALSSPFIAQSAASCGCKVVFADIEKSTCVISPDWVEALCADSDVKAVICEDYRGYPCDYAKIKAVLPEGVKLIVVTPDVFNTKFDGKLTVTYSDAAVAVFEEGCAIEATCAAVVTKDENYVALWSAHHCGNLPSGSNMESLSAGAMLGGDMRISEWTSAVLINEINAFKAIPKPDLSSSMLYCDGIATVDGGERSPFVQYNAVKHYAMNTEPAFVSDYYRKETGDAGTPNVCPFAQKLAKY